MPIFEYLCQTCEKSFETLVLSGDDKDVSCPECSDKNVQRLMSVAGFIGSKSVAQGCAPVPNKGFS